MSEPCQTCAERGVDRPATHDAKLPWGPWAYICGYCLYRLPANLRPLARKLVLA